MKSGPVLSTPKIRVMIVNDARAPHGNLRLLLSSAGDIEVVGETADCEETVRTVRETRPDVILLDVDSGFASAMETTRRLCREVRKARVLVRTGYTDEKHIFHVI